MSLFLSFIYHLLLHHRLVTEINLERKMKSQKAKTKLSEGRKQLSSVRVIQRNLVYIVGLPLNLADEDVCFSLPLSHSMYMAPKHGFISTNSFSSAKNILACMGRF